MYTRKVSTKEQLKETRRVKKIREHKLENESDDKIIDFDYGINSKEPLLVQIERYYNGKVERNELLEKIKYAHKNDEDIQEFEIGYLINRTERAQELDADNYNIGVELEKLHEQNERYREAVEYVMTANPGHYQSVESALDDINFVISELLEGK